MSIVISLIYQYLFGFPNFLFKEKKIFLLEANAQAISVDEFSIICQQIEENIIFNKIKC